MSKIKDSEMQVWLGVMLDQSVRQTAALGRIEQLLRGGAPADAAPLPTVDYRRGKPKKAPPRSKYRGCC